MFARERHLALGIALAERADRTHRFIGLGDWRPQGLRLFVLEDETAVRRLSRNRIPDWGVGLAIPSARTVAIRIDAADPEAALRHELAHVALHDRIRGRVPLWFDEGYAVVAAGELGRLVALQLNLAVVRGAVTDFETLNAGLRLGAGEAETSYALAGSAVLFLMRLTPGGGLEALIGRLAEGDPFATAVHTVTGYEVSVIERAWQRDLRKRYGWFVWVVAGGGWAVVALSIGAIAAWRRHRDQPRREALNEGWVIPDESLEPGGPENGPDHPQSS